MKSDDTVARERAIQKLILPESLKQALASDDAKIRNQAIAALTRGSPSALRFSGSGEYAGVMVSCLAIFALVQSLRRTGCYASTERKAVWLWGGAAAISVLASWGRFGPLYQFLYQLPYAYTIRNPIKFMHPFHLAWLILAAYGLEGVWRILSRPEAARLARVAKIAGVFGLLAAAALAAPFIFNSRLPTLIDYLTGEGFSPDEARGIAVFSQGELRWFAVWLIASLAVFLAIFTLRRTEANRRWLWVGIALLIILDLAKSDLPWIRFFDYREVYAANRLLDFLADKPYGHRVTGRLSPRGLGASLNSPLGQVVFKWLENDFPARNIETLDFAQWLRMPALDAAYLNNFALVGADLRNADLHPSLRLWQLTNTRYLLAPMEILPLLETQASPLHVVMRLQAMSNSVAEDANGPYALVETPSVLPRVRLYSSWKYEPDETAALKTLASPEFNPADTVLVGTQTPPSNSSAETAGEAAITEYHPRRVTIRADARRPAILLLNDRYDLNWKSTVDGKEAPVLRCNYLMRGVYLPEGSHTVVFHFQPPTWPLYITLGGWAAGAVLAASLVRRR